jgi:hypothetical protein
MTQTSMPISKRTKQEILEEYKQMKDQLEELRSVANTVHSQPTSELIEKTVAKTPQVIDKMFSDFQTSLHTHLTDIRTSILEQSTMLQDFQRAVELSKQRLELQRHITLAADSLDLLVEDQTKRATLFNTEMEEKKIAIEEQITAKKKLWEREAEEYEYQKKLRLERDQVETEEREKSLAAREAAIHAQEREIAEMKKTIEQFPKELDGALAKKEQETTERLTQTFSHEKTLMEKESGSQARLLELTVGNLQERLTASLQEITSLKQQTEEANAKAQALAVKAIERPTTVMNPINPPQSSQAGYNERQQGRGNV